MLIAGYFATLFMGVTLGLLGGGGSILTVPILVYLFRVPAHDAIHLSYFVVGTTALFGILPKQARIQVKPPVVAWFGIASIVTVIAVRRLLLPLIPEHIGSIGKDELLLMLFAIVMLGASISMFRKSPPPSTDPIQPGRLIVGGLGVGFIAGLVGAGGGGLIVPVLIRYAGLEVRAAISSALAIIVLNSAVGFIASDSVGGDLFRLVLVLTGIAIAGSLLGSKLAAYVKAETLKPAFGVFVLAMGAFVLGEHFLR